MLMCELMRRVLSERRAKKGSDLDGVSDCQGRSENTSYGGVLSSLRAMNSWTRPVKGSGGNDLIHHKDTTVK